MLADADGSYNLDDIRHLVQRVQDGADLALGSRYLPELYGVELTDALFFYMAIRRDVVRSITVTAPGFEYIVEFLIKAQRSGFKFAEIPSLEKSRTAGKSKVNAFRDGLRMLWIMIRARVRGGNF